MCKYVNGGGVNCNLTLFVEIKARLLIVLLSGTMEVSLSAFYPIDNLYY